MAAADSAFKGVQPPSAGFLKAVEDATKIQVASDEAKLRLYALYKQATEGDNPRSKPGFTQVVARAKWTAWDQVRGATQEHAQEEYVKEVRKLLGDGDESEPASPAPGDNAMKAYFRSKSEEELDPQRFRIASSTSLDSTSPRQGRPRAETNFAFYTAVHAARSEPEIAAHGRLEALYEQATEGDDDDQQPRWFHPRKRARWAQRNALRGMPRWQAEDQYCDLVRQLAPEALEKAEFQALERSAAAGGSWRAEVPKWVERLPAPALLAWAEGFGEVSVRVLRARGLLAADYHLTSRSVSSDPYVLARAEGRELRTPHVRKSVNPDWNVCDPPLMLRVRNAAATLTLEVFDYDAVTSDDYLGSATVSVAELVPGQPWRGWLRLRYNGETAGALEVELVLTVNTRRLRWAILSGVPPAEAAGEAPRLDLEAVQHGLRTVDAFLLRPALAVVEEVLAILRWTDPARSGVVCFTLMAGAYLHVLCATLLLGLAVLLYSAERSAKEVTFDEDAFSFVRWASLAPPGVKRRLVSLQSSILGLEGTAIALHDMVTWRVPPRTSAVCRALVGCACLLLFLTHRGVLWQTHVLLALIAGAFTALTPTFHLGVRLLLGGVALLCRRAPSERLCAPEAMVSGATRPPKAWLPEPGSRPARG